MAWLGCDNILRSLQALYAGDRVVSEVNGVMTRPVFLRRGLRQGCSLSPLLFALYISDLGRDVSTSPLGYTIGDLTVSGLSFADDIVLISDSPEKLQLLRTGQGGLGRFRIGTVTPLVLLFKLSFFKPTPLFLFV